MPFPRLVRVNSVETERRTKRKSIQNPRTTEQTFPKTRKWLGEGSIADGCRETDPWTGRNVAVKVFKSAGEIETSLSEGKLKERIRLES
jgi:hypothetical protein